MGLYGYLANLARYSQAGITFVDLFFSSNLVTYFRVGDKLGEFRRDFVVRPMYMFLLQFEEINYEIYYQSEKISPIPYKDRKRCFTDIKEIGLLYF